MTVIEEVEESSTYLAKCKLCAINTTIWGELVCQECQEKMVEPARQTMEEKEGALNKDEAEREDNMVVVVEVQGKKYRVDFTRNSEEYQLLPRGIKKAIAKEQIEEMLAAENNRVAQLEADIDKLKKLAPEQYNRATQQDKKEGIVARLRKKLLAKNPLRKDVKDM